MSKENLNISKIETYLNSIVDGVVSNNTYFTTLPDKSVIDSSDWSDIVLIDFPMGIKDFDAYGRGEVDIVLYARPFGSGKKNVPKMAELEEKLNEAISNAPITNYALRRDDVHSAYDTDIKWHCNVYTYIIQVI